MDASAGKNPSSFSSIPGRLNPRNSEVNNPIRRSFSGSPVAKPSIVTSHRSGFNPNTPANSPSDYPRRKSFGGENIVVSLRDSEDKENSKDQNVKQARVRSPASSKGTRNFMSPTISATSKINASPRKKILTERNEPTRTSVSCFDCKSPLKEDLDTKPEKGFNQKKEVTFDPTITYLEDKETSKSNEDYSAMVHSSAEDGRESLSESVPPEKSWKAHLNQKEVPSNPTITNLEDKETMKSNEIFDTLVHTNTKDDWDSISRSITMDKDCVNLDPSFNISPRASCPLAPLDADPLMLRYDPKINYLSPRPKFLHYKPNPRIQLYLNKEIDGKGLEENSASETSSDAEVTEEETLSDDSQRESEEASSGDVLIKEEEEEEDDEDDEEELLVSEPNPICTSNGAAEAKRVAKPQFFTKRKLTGFLLILAIACLWASVTYSPIMDPSVLNNLSFSDLYVPPEISEFIVDNLEGVSQKFQQWVYDSLSYIHNQITSFRERLKPGPLQFANLTALLEDGLVDNFLVDHSNFGAAVKYERNKEVVIKSLEEEKEDQLIEIDEDVEIEGDEVEVDDNVEVEGYDMETEESIEESAEGEMNDQEYKEEKVIAADDSAVLESLEEEKEDQLIEIDENVEIEGDEVEVDDNVEVEGYDMETEENIEESAEGEKNDQEYKEEKVIAADDSAVLESEEVKMTEPASCIVQPQSKIDVIELLVPISQADKTQADNSYPTQSLAENDMSSAETESSITDNKPESFHSNAAMNLAINGIKNIFSSQAVRISLLVFGLLAGFVFIYIKNKTSTTPNVDQAPVTKKMDYSPLSVTGEHTSQERTKEVETDGESSCPSEMSSIQYSYSSSYSKGRKVSTSEAQRQEMKHRRNTRRESLASSDYSTGSPSYGSFTSYEKIINKNGNVEDELLTPVRRSSRIRNHVTSP